MNTKKPMTIAGAGLVGSFLAYWLTQEGYEVDVLEKRSDPRQESKDAGRSINLVVTHRGIEALKQVGLWETVKKITVPVYGRVVHPLEREDYFQPYGVGPSERNYSVSRSELNKLLIQIASEKGARFHFGSDIHDIDLDKKIIALKNGQAVNYERLFAADGAGSVVRKTLVNEGVLEEKVEFLNCEYKELLMPLTDEDKAPLRVDGLHIWPRGKHFLMGLPNKDHSFTMTLYLPRDESPCFEDLQTSQSLKAYFEKTYPEVPKLMPNLEEDFFKNPEGKLGTVKANVWHYTDEIVLLGDAAHAVVPFFGQGMNAGLEDCHVLMNAWKEEQNWGKAFSRYSAEHVVDGHAIADMAVENYWEMSQKVAEPEFIKKKKVEQKLEKSFPEVFRSRYAYVVYSSVPYGQAKELGEIQDRLLDELSARLSTPEDLDLEKAKSLLDKRILPYLREKGITPPATS